LKEEFNKLNEEKQSRTKSTNDTMIIKIPKTRKKKKENLLVGMNLLKEEDLLSTSNILTRKQSSVYFQNQTKKQARFTEEEVLSQLDETEASIFILSEEEFELKKKLWEILNSDWLKEQAIKKRKKDAPIAKRTRSQTNDFIHSKNPIDAIKNSDKFGTRINYNLLSELFT
jgi:hypothetical protein